MSFFQHFISKLVGKDKNKFSTPHIEGCEDVVVDSSLLCCPICYDVYSSCPLSLRCGHTFCSTCMINMSKVESVGKADREKTITCPFCRETSLLRFTVKNYVIDDIVRKMQQYPTDERLIQKLTQNTLVLAKQRAEQQVKTLERENTNLSNSLNRELRWRKQATVVVIILCGIVLGLLLRRL